MAGDKRGRQKGSLRFAGENMAAAASAHIYGQFQFFRIFLFILLSPNENSFSCSELLFAKDYVEIFTFRKGNAIKYV